MILVDTSVWIDHLRVGSSTLARRLEAFSVLTHDFVIGELALGTLRRRASFLQDLQALPRVSVATDAEVLLLIDRQGLAGLGIGYVDAHLLASVLLTPGVALWSRNRRLLAVAERIGVETALDKPE